MTTSWSIRRTYPADRDAIVDIVREAFSSADRDGQEEVGIVLNTWLLDAAVPELDMVAIEGGQVVGYVLGAYGRLGEREVIGVAPLAVAPHSQGKGIGSALMTEVLRSAEEVGEPLLVLLGLPSTTVDSASSPLGQSESTTYLSVQETRIS